MAPTKDPDDPFAFAFDYTVSDAEHGIVTSVTLCDARDDDLQFRLKSGTLDIPYFLALDKAAELASAILAALRGTPEDQVLLSATMALHTERGQ